MEGRILISAAGSGGTNRLVESVTGYRKKFVGINADKYRVLTSVLEDNFLVPHAGKEQEYVEAINEIVKKCDICFFIPNSDLEVYTVSKHIDKIGVKTFIPNFDTVDTCFDKWKLHKKMMFLNIASAESFLVENYKIIREAFGTIKSRPLWCRVRKGSGSKFSTKVISPEDAEYYIRHCINAYGLKIDDFILSEYLPGDDMAVLTIWDNGVLRLCKMAKRTKYSAFPGESPPVVIESFYDANVEKYVVDAIKKLDKRANGLFCVDIKCFSDGSPAITEINPGRFYYNMPVFNAGKINVLEFFLDLAFGKTMDFLKEDTNVVFLREQDNEPYVISKEMISKAKMEFWYENRKCRSQ